MAEHIPPAPNWPAPPPPVQNEQSRPLPDVAQRLVQHLAEHGIQPARNMAEHIPPAPNWPAPPRQYKMNNQDLCLMWLSVWCSILQSMAL
ncbi:T3SS effector TccP2, partial [Escherichia coli O103:H25 str. CVM9340]